MISFPNAKITLGLNILNKQKDGYHSIESCFYPIPWHDSLEIMKAESFSFHPYGLKIPGYTGSNLCIRAYEVLKENHHLGPVEIHLLKAIPMGSGMGGGSADGAFTLKMLDELFELNLTSQELKVYALQLGSDCPFFIDNKPALASGRGELLEAIDLDLKGYHLAVQNPGIHIPTKKAYSEVDPAYSNVSIAEILPSQVNDWKGTLINDFEASIFKKYPEIGNLKEKMYNAGALYTSMTGSGSTVYGLFEDEVINNDWKILKL